MPDLALVPLGDAGREFVLNHLADVNVFCSALRNRLDTAMGEVYALAPTGTPQERLLSFRQGGLLIENLDRSRAIKVHDGWIMPVESLRSQQARLIVAMLKGAPRCCVVDDFNPEWDDPRRQYDLGATSFGVGQAVYHWFDRRHEAEDIRATLQQADTIWHGVSAVCACPPPKLPTTEVWLQEAAHTAVAVFCSAYDGEGFVMWRPGGSLT